MNFKTLFVFSLTIAAMASARRLPLQAQGLAGTGLTMASVQSAAADSKDIGCARKSEWDSRIFILRMKNGSSDGKAREVRLRFNSCSHYAGQETEERWFSDDLHSTGFAIANRIGSDSETGVAFFQTRGDPQKLCVSASFGKRSNATIYKTGFSMAGVRFDDICAGSNWISDVQVIPLAF